MEIYAKYTEIGKRTLIQASEMVSKAKTTEEVQMLEASLQSQLVGLKRKFAELEKEKFDEIMRTIEKPATIDMTALLDEFDKQQLSNLKNEK